MVTSAIDKCNIVWFTTSETGRGVVKGKKKIMETAETDDKPYCFFVISHFLFAQVSGGNVPVSQWTRDLTENVNGGERR